MKYTYSPGDAWVCQDTFETVSLAGNLHEDAKTILVVDDEREVLHVIESMLADAGYAVVTASSAEMAIEAFDKMPAGPDLLLTDVVMPGISGPMLVDHLLAKRPKLKVLFMSGYDNRQVVQRYVVEKGFRLISKPLSVKLLRAALRSEIEAGSEAELKR
jgi:two-component system cell cycle sensor histidine kinase/response regulator CckA